MTPEIKEYIDKAISEAFAFSTTKYGDTPTDALQLVNKKYVDGRVYVGAWVDTGAGINTVFLPTGWSVVKNSTGNYTVTHNLRRTDYCVAAMNNAYIPVLVDIANQSNTFGILLRDLTTGAPANNNVWFILAVKS